MKIALIADLHLSDVENTPQDESFNWALDELTQLQPDVCVWLGDITACGAPDAAMRFRKKINMLPFPSVILPGNSDIRTAATAPVMERFLMNYPHGYLLDGLRIVNVNTSHDKIDDDERTRLSQLAITENVLLCTHQSPKHLDDSSREFFRNWIKGVEDAGHRVIAWVHGHVHQYRTLDFEGVPAVAIRALDLDKCIGGDAHICVLTTDGNSTSFDEIPYTCSALDTWTAQERFEIADLLGITCYNRSKVERDMPFAIENGVKHLEWRSIQEGDLPLLDQWRCAGGQTFSLHLSGLTSDGSQIKGSERFLEYVHDAIRANADMVTVHPPGPLNEIMLSGDTFDALADEMAEALRPLTEAGIDILVENNHTAHGTPRDPLKRSFGCSPLELTGWRDALNERLGNNACHLRLDIGHARNNVPLSQNYPLGKWYSLIGNEVRSYHLHQTVGDKTDNSMKNHHPITGLHDGMVSFDGFLWAWHTGLLNRAPIILEIREGEGACATWQRLHNIFLEGL